MGGEKLQLLNCNTNKRASPWPNDKVLDIRREKIKIIKKRQKKKRHDYVFGMETTKMMKTTNN